MFLEGGDVGRGSPLIAHNGAHVVAFCVNDLPYLHAVRRHVQQLRGADVGQDGAGPAARLPLLVQALRQLHQPICRQCGRHQRHHSARTHAPGSAPPQRGGRRRACGAGRCVCERACVRACGGAPGPEPKRHSPMSQATRTESASSSASVNVLCSAACEQETG